MCGYTIDVACSFGISRALKSLLYKIIMYKTKSPEKLCPVLYEKLNRSFFFLSYRQRNPSGDPFICGIAVLIAMPFLYFVLIFSKDNLILTWIFVFIAEALLCSNWALISDMLMVEFSFSNSINHLSL